MRCAIAIVLAMTAAARADDTPTCDQAVDHEMSLVHGLDDAQRTHARTESLARCASVPWSDALRSCVLAAQDLDAVDACRAAGNRLALHVALPAIAQDGATVALPIDADADLALAPLGETTGETIELAGLAADTRIAGYAALPYGARRAGGVALTIGKHHRLVFRAGKKIVARARVEGEVRGFAVVRGKPAWIYVETSTGWTALRARLSHS